MTVLYCEINKFSNIYLYLIMDTTVQNTAKESPSGSVPLNHDLLDVQSDWSRCNSFSSSSNDSSVFCNNRLQNSALPLGKRLANDKPTTRLSKRSRNSSGSSVSSNMSCLSDKDTKKTSVIVSSNYVPPIPSNKAGIRTNVQSLSRLSCPDISHPNFNLNHKELLSRHISCPDPSNSILPFRHNLRRNIRKKTCSCDCTATCTTLVVRRYNKVGKETMEEQTLISTKVQTCPNNNTQTIHNVSYKESFSPNKSDSNRRRRSEVEKLYESLHEIEWAKNFSPDNILRQINIRQAASVSMFGKSSKCRSGDLRSSRRRKDLTELMSKSTSFKDQMESRKMKQNSLSEKSSPRTRSKTRSSRRNSISSCSTTIKSKKSPVKYESTSSTKSYSEEKLKCHLTCSKECSSHDSEFKSECSESSVSCSVDESSYTGFGQVVDVKSTDLLESPVLKSENYLSDFKNESDEDIPIPDITSDITFFDIAEEGIRTIDACFREVGAEVVISTCYEDDFDLPRLTSVKDNLSDPIDNDIPPVLECCVNVQEQVCSQILECNIVSDSEKMYAHKENLKGGNCANSSIKNFNGMTYPKMLINKTSQHSDPLKIFKKLRSFNKTLNRTLLLNAGKRILNKYLKFLYCKAKLKKPLLNTAAKLSEKVPNHLDSLSLRNHKIPKSNIGVNKNESFAEKSMMSNPISSSFASKSSDLLCHTIDEHVKTLKNTVQKTSFSVESSKEIPFSRSKSNSYLCPSEKQKNISQSTAENTKYPSMVLQESSSFCIQHKSTASTSNGSVHELTGPRTPFTCYYRTLVVTKAQGYAQVVLKFTRKRSIFLTVEALKELKDLVNRVGRDPNCHTFILNGIADIFCLGLDLKPLLGPQKIKNSNEMAVAVKEFIEALSAFKKPFVAVVNGPAIGLGMTILTHADISIASDKATFCMPQTSLGYFPEGGATLTLPQAVGSTIAMDIILRGRTLTAAEAKDIGLVSEVVEAKNLSQDLVARVKKLAENSISCMETTKAMLKMRLHLELLSVLENEVKLLPQMWLSQACQEALQNALDTGMWSD